MFNAAFAGDLPIQGTDIAVQWDLLYNFLVWLSLFFFVLVVGGIIYFAIRYRSSVSKKTKYLTGSHVLEALFVGVPTILLLVIFAWGYFVYHDMTATPLGAYEIRVIGKQWAWTFQYDTGVTTSGELFVPINRPVKLVMTSEDVLHDFFIPNFRIKQDVVPGMYTSVWFEAKVAGRHQVYCAEYCGTAHSQMLANLNVLTDEQWKIWTRGGKIGPLPDAGSDTVSAPMAATDKTPEGAKPKLLNLVDQGADLMKAKGCVACHTADGAKAIGPTYKGLFGTKVDLEGGISVTADENYIRESIENPQAKLVKGFQGVMPTFKGQLSETELNALIAYIKSLK